MSEIGILVTGDRNWEDESLVETLLSHFKAQPITLIHGGCSGLDSIAGEIGKKLGFTVKVFEADWQTYKLFAGPVRNKQMVEYVKTFPNHFVFAFHDDLENSKGTKNCVGTAKKFGLQVILVSH